MISRITKLLLALQLLVALGLFFLMMICFRINPWLAFMISATAVLCFRVLVSANNFLIAWRYRSETPPEQRIGCAQSVELFINEFNATMLTSSVNMPFRQVIPFINGKSDTLPVLLVHGYGCNSGEWHPISVRLIEEGISHYAVDLEPVFGDIDLYVSVISNAVTQLRKVTGNDKIVILAHSMGGLAVRAYIRDHGSSHIAKVITLGTPHHGTALANFGIGLNSFQMRWIGNASTGVSSEWLQKLAREENQANYRLFVSIYSHHDNIVAPQMSSELIGTRNIPLRGIGHVALLFDKTVQNQVIEEIRITMKVPTV